jgi:hypothetical protein
MLRPNNKISGLKRFLDSIKNELNSPNVLVTPSNVNLQVLRTTVISHNISLNGFISEEDIDQQFNCPPYQVYWNNTIFRLTWKPLRTYFTLSCYWVLKERFVIQILTNWKI